MLTTTKITTGEFTVQWNGQPSGYRIVNGSLGLSGRDTLNMYGVVRAGQPVKWIGSIASCKKVLALTFNRQEPSP